MAEVEFKAGGVIYHYGKAYERVGNSYYPVDQVHLLGSVLQEAIDGFEAAAARFGADAIHDTNLREIYKENINRMSASVLEEVKSGKMTVKQGAEFCNEMRNKIMAETRQVTSPARLAKLQLIKPDSGVPLEESLNKYSVDLYKKPFSTLTGAERTKAYYSVIESAGRDNAKVTAGTKKLQIQGKVLILVTAVLAVGNVVLAENKKKEVIRQGAIIGGGLGGGFAAGLTVSWICGPAAPVCATAVVLIGSVAGGILAEAVVDTFDEELEEFTKWQIQ
jgi:hypothetical protein